MPIYRSYWRPKAPEHPYMPVGYAYNEDSYISFMDPVKAFSYFKGGLDGEYSRSSNFFIGDWRAGHFGPWGLTQSGSESPLPDIVYDYPTIKSNNYLAWQESQKPGSISIVVSPYQKGRYTIKQFRGSTDLSVTDRLEVSHSLSACRFLTTEPGHLPDTVKYSGFSWATSATICRQGYEKVSGTFNVSPLDLGFPFEELTGYLKSLPSDMKLNLELITDTLADANTGWVDLLTSLAEAPEFLASVLRGCKEIVRLYIDCKNKDLRLANSAKIVRLKLERAQARASSDWADIKAREKHLQDVKTLKKELVALTDAIASVWLNYRLNIYPTAKTIEAALEASEMLNDLFLRFRDQITEDLDFPEFSGWSRQGDLRLKRRCFIKRGAREAEMKDLLFTQNSLLTMWELVPLSFVVDRYINLGNFIAAFFHRRDPKVTEGSTFSWRIEGGCVYTHDNTGASISVDVDFYKRVVIDPSRLVCIPMPQSRSVPQQLDHLALSWHLLIKRLVT